MLSKKAQGVERKLRKALRVAQKDRGVIDGQFMVSASSGRWKATGPVCAIGAVLIGQPVRRERTYNTALLLDYSEEYVEDIIAGFDATSMSNQTVYTKIGARLRREFLPTA